MANKPISELRELVAALPGLTNEMQIALENFLSVIEKASEPPLQQELLDRFVQLLDAFASGDLGRIEQAANELAKVVEGYGLMGNNSSTKQ
jgi:hypothetical protein